MYGMPPQPSDASTGVDPVDAPGVEDAASTMRSVAKDGPPEAATAALVKRYQGLVLGWKKHHDKAFKRMRRDAAFATNRNGAQWRDAGIDVPLNGIDSTDERYVANITHRHIQAKVASLYAKNPRVKSVRNKKIDTVLWDGTPEMLQQAQQMVMSATQMAAAGQMPPPGLNVAAAQAVLQEANAIKQQHALLDKIGTTAEIMYHHFLDEGEPDFKSRAKKWVARTITTGVGWVKLDFQRERGYTPEMESPIRDLSLEIDRLQSQLEKVAEDEIPEGSADLAELQAQLARLQSQPDVVISEGLVFDFPKSWRVIVDDKCSQLPGLIGCMGMAHEFMSTPDDIREHYKVDIASEFKTYVAKDKDGKERKEACVWEVYDKRTGLMCVICEGYPDFLVAPGSPRINVKRFFPFFPLTFNEVESDDDADIYPPSDVSLLMPMQREYNRSREALRQHRIASQPGHVANATAFANEDDVKKMASRTPHEVVILKGFPVDKPIANVLQAIPLNTIDPNVYQVENSFQDIQRTIGDQEANLGGTSGNTATESSIAESSRMGTVDSNRSDLDMCLGELARAGRHVMLCEISPETAKQIAGDGAIWPHSTGAQIAEEISLNIVAGSSGKPNRDRDAANFQRMMPIAIQIPGLNPQWLGKQAVQLMDETVDLEDAYLAGLPSIMAMNAMTTAAATAPQPPTGNPATDPGQQGGKGGDNTQRPPGSQGGEHPGYPGGRPQPPPGAPGAGGPVPPTP